MHVGRQRNDNAKAGCARQFMAFSSSLSIGQSEVEWIRRRRRLAWWSERKRAVTSRGWNWDELDRIGRENGEWKRLGTLGLSGICFSRLPIVNSACV